MARRPTMRKAFNLEVLESRQLLSTVSSAAPSAETQYMLELVNLMRTNPKAAAERFTTNLDAPTQDTLKYFGVNLNQVRQDIASSQARQPLAWSNSLAKAAQAHSQDMASNGFQSHTGSDGSSPEQRMQQAGFTNASRTAENAFAYAESVDQAMQAFAIDWGVADQGHRRNLLEPNTPADNTFKQIGIGIANSNKPGFGKVITQDFGLKQNSPSYLLGVTYDDLNHDNFYSIGEGEGGVTIDATDTQTGKTYSTQSASAGGYQIALPAGQYQVKALIGNQVVGNQNVQIGNQNVKVDFVLNNLESTTPTDSGSGSQKSPSSTPVPTPIVSTPTQPTVAVKTVQVQAQAPPTVAPPAQTTPTVSIPTTQTTWQVSQPTVDSTTAPAQPVVEAQTLASSTDSSSSQANSQQSTAKDTESYSIFNGNNQINWDIWSSVPTA